MKITSKVLRKMIKEEIQKMRKWEMLIPVVQIDNNLIEFKCHDCGETNEVELDSGNIAKYEVEGSGEESQYHCECEYCGHDNTLNLNTISPESAEYMSFIPDLGKVGPYARHDSRANHNDWYGDNW